MTTDTTPAAIEALMKDVTPGPWELEGNWDASRKKVGGWLTHRQAYAMFELVPLTGEVAEIAANARFIAAARDLVPALAAELTVMRSERDEARNAYNDMEIKWALAISRAEKAETELSTARDERDEARAEGAKLAAWQCSFTDGKTGLVCDEYGNQFCAMQRHAEKATAELAALRKEVAEHRAGQQYRYIGKDGKAVLARDLEDERDDFRKEVERLRVEPIATAPKDGTRVLAYWPPVLGDENDGWVTTWFGTNAGGQSGWETPWEYADEETCPTHWMPNIVPNRLTAEPLGHGVTADDFGGEA